MGFEQPKAFVVAEPEIDAVLLGESRGEPDCLVSR
jgi:hypothetical protein